MSTTADKVAEDQVSIEIDGVNMQVPKGCMIIEAADKADIAIPRFCYHKKLSIAANCRMCLVEVEKAPKPMPACATPVMDGMKIYTRSDKAQASQRAVMEFLLINHPLDCPICDQGGECELQDLALGYGGSISRFTEKKRVVKDKNIGPLISTDMTRCIHCTRCIRFLEEIAGSKELGATGRGENLEIGTYIERSVDSEMSGNVIDVCPVGALTSRPFRFSARAWELTQHASIAPHDAVGSNILLHSRGGKVMRTVPRENEDVNEVWLSDRDRFSYQGLNSDERLLQPMQKIDGQWQALSWEEALQAASNGLQGVIDARGADQAGFLVSPAATIEEMYLLQGLAAGLGSTNIDHRLRQSDFSDQDRVPLFPWLGQGIADCEQLDCALLVGSDVRREHPIIAHRLRKAVKNGARLQFVNPVAYDFCSEASQSIVVAPSKMVAELAALASAVLSARGASAPNELASLLSSANADDQHKEMAAQLLDGTRSAVLLGNIATAHPAYSVLRALASFIAVQTGANFGYLGDAANSAGAWLAGVLPHRGPGGAARQTQGASAKEMIDNPRAAYLLFGVEPEYDCADGAAALQAMKQAEFVVSLSSFTSDAMKEYADVLLPLASFAETSGTFVNNEGRWQSFTGANKPVGEARPGWKIVRVLANLLDLSGYDYTSSFEVREVLVEEIGSGAADNGMESGSVSEYKHSSGLERIGTVPMYKVDSLVRRASALQQTIDGKDATASICTSDADAAGLVQGGQVRVKQGEGVVDLAVEIDDRIPEGCVLIPAACASSVALGSAFGSVTLEGSQ